MSFDRILDQARSRAMRIALPEARDPRVLMAARRAKDEGIASPVLTGNTEQIMLSADSAGITIDDLDIIDTSNSDERQVLAEQLYQTRKHRGMTQEAAESGISDALVFACMMVRENIADGCVAGAVNTTADVIRAALQLIGKRNDIPLVSSFFIMLINQPQPPIEDTIVFADCALTIEPDASELASIAVTTGESAQQLLAIDPRIAMLSFSTNGSARHASVTKVREATIEVKTTRPQWRVIGDVQLDAAIIPSILKSKAPEMATDEAANILIFPSLEAGNIGYKICERFGHADAIGPVLQGLKKPVNDLSRGCKTDDIFRIIAVTSVQAQYVTAKTKTL